RFANSIVFKISWEGGGVSPNPHKGHQEGRKIKMGFEDVPRCQHVKVNGVQCASPALRRKPYCYFHERVQYERKLAAEDKSAARNFGFPLFEDANSIQVALMKTVQMLG